MRVAISGTHCYGKSTLIDQFLLAHPEYEHESEPYTVLVEEYGETFGAEPSAADFYRQLEFMVETFENYTVGERVVFERSPVDFVAYMLALDDLDRDKDGKRFVQQSLELARDAIQHLDLIVFVPLSGKDTVDDDEDPPLRSAVNERLVGIYREGDFDLFASDRPPVVEAFGTTAERLQTLERALST